MGLINKAVQQARSASAAREKADGRSLRQQERKALQSNAAAARDRRTK